MKVRNHQSQDLTHLPEQSICKFRDEWLKLEGYITESHGRKFVTSGFTLVELLIVFAIIGILAGVVLISLTSARAKARDAQRVADVRQLMKALELFYNDNNNYPQETDNSPDMDDGAIPFNTYIAGIPKAPIPADNPVGGPKICADGGTAPTNIYDYNASGANPSDYEIMFCLGAPTESLPVAGLHTASPQGLR